MAEQPLPSNISDFNRFAAVVFDILYESFPVPIDFDLCEEYKIARSLDLTDEVTEQFDEMNPPIFSTRPLTNGTTFNAMLWGVMKWLAEESFIRAEGDIYTVNVVLTSKSITVLGAAPEGEGPTLGARLKKAAQTAGNAAGTASLNQTVVQVIGYAFRNMIGV